MLKVEFQGEDNEILVVTLNRPEVMNAMNTQMLEERLSFSVSRRTTKR